MNRQLSIRLDDDAIGCLEEIEAKAAQPNSTIPSTRSGIFREALLEYYARVMDQTTLGSYTSLMESTLNALVGPYCKSQHDILKAILNGIETNAEIIEKGQIQNEISFDLIFRSGGLTEEPEKLRKVIEKPYMYSQVIRDISLKRLSLQNEKQKSDECE